METTRKYEVTKFFKMDSDHKYCVSETKIGRKIVATFKTREEAIAFVKVQK